MHTPTPDSSLQGGAEAAEAELALLQLNVSQGQGKKATLGLKTRRLREEEQVT